MNTIRAVLFDLDGTLLDSAPDLVAALNWLRASEGLPALAVDEMSRHASHGAAGLLKAGMPESGIELFEQRKSSFLQRYANHSFQQSSLYQGVTDLLDFLQSSGIPWGIVTNKVESLTLPIMQAAGLHSSASCVVCGDTLSQSKPDPAPVLLACDRLGVSSQNTIFVGDDIRDIQAGRAAGTMTAAVHYGYGSSELLTDNLAKQSIALHHPTDLISVISSNNA